MQVLESIPLSLHKTAHPIYVFVLPSSGILGNSESTFENVKVTSYDADFSETGPGNVEFFSVGRLGALHGGLLHLDDFRKVISQEDLAIVQRDTATEAIHKLRPEDVEVLIPNISQLKLNLYRYTLYRPCSVMDPSKIHYSTGNGIC